MTAPKIPESLDPELLSRANAGQSTRDIAEWLVEAKHLRTCSHMKVSRRLQALRAAQVAAPNATEEELERLLRTNGDLIGDSLESLLELEEAATYGDEERGLKPDLALAERIARRRASMLENRQKYLMLRLTMLHEAKRRVEAREREQAWRTETQTRFQHLFSDARTEVRRPAAPPPERIAQPTVAQPPVAAPPPAKPPERAEPKPGRNAPCPCGSGRKWKKCHGGPAVEAVTPAVTLTPRTTANGPVLRASSNPIG